MLDRMFNMLKQMDERLNKMEERIDRRMEAFEKRLGDVQGGEDRPLESDEEPAHQTSAQKPELPEPIRTQGAKTPTYAQVVEGSQKRKKAYQDEEAESFTTVGSIRRFSLQSCGVSPIRPGMAMSNKFGVLEEEEGSQGEMRGETEYKERRQDAEDEEKREENQRKKPTLVVTPKKKKAQPLKRRKSILFQRAKEEDMEISMVTVQGQPSPYQPLKNKEIPKWRGPRKERPQDWLHKFELQAQGSKWAPDVLLAAAGLAFTEAPASVGRWHRGMMARIEEGNPKEIWEWFRGEFLEKYVEVDECNQKMEQWMKAQQKEGESVVSYAERYEQYVEEVEEQQGEDFANWRDQITKMFVKGLHESISANVDAHRPGTLDEAVRVARKLEGWRDKDLERPVIPVKHRDFGSRKRVAVAEAIMESEDSEEEIMIKIAKKDVEAVEAFLDKWNDPSRVSQATVGAEAGRDTSGTRRAAVKGSASTIERRDVLEEIGVATQEAWGKYYEGKKRMVRGGQSRLG